MIDFDYVYTDGSRIDDASAALLKRPMSLIMKTTGKDNFFCAKACMWIAISMGLLHSLYRLGLDVFEGNLPGVGWHILVALLWGLLFPRLYKNHIRAAEKVMSRRDGSGTIGLSMSEYDDLKSLISSRKWDMFFFAVLLFLAGVSTTWTVAPLVWFLLALCLYFCTHGYPGGKNVVARAKAKVKAALSSVKVPQLSPNPVPVSNYHATQ